jgi:hypothetical protein
MRKTYLTKSTAPEVKVSRSVRKAFKLGSTEVYTVSFRGNDGELSLLAVYDVAIVLQ